MTAIEKSDPAVPGEEVLCSNIRKNARQVREARGWTHERVGQSLGMSVREYQEFEGGEGVFDPSTTLTLSFVLQVSMEELLGWVSVDLQRIASQQKLIETIKGICRRFCSPAAREAFLDILEETLNNIETVQDLCSQTLDQRHLH